MKDSIEFLVALLCALVALAMLPAESELIEEKEVAKLVKLDPRTVDEVEIQFESLNQVWKMPEGRWIEDGDDVDAAVFGVMYAIGSFEELPMSEVDQKPIGFIRYVEKGQEKTIRLSEPKFGNSLAFEIEGTWYMGNGNLLFKINQLKEALAKAENSK